MLLNSFHTVYSRISSRALIPNLGEERGGAYSRESLNRGGRGRLTLFSPSLRQISSVIL